MKLDKYEEDIEKNFVNQQSVKTIDQLENFKKSAELHNAITEKQ